MGYEAGWQAGAAPGPAPAFPEPWHPGLNRLTTGNMLQKPSADRLAQQLLDHEAGEQSSAVELTEATSRILGRLHQQLARLVGAAGCDLLMSRALARSAGMHPLLADVRWRPGAPAGRERPPAPLADQDPHAARTACVTLLATFLKLLADFIGEDLAFRQVQRAWPELLPPTGDPGFDR